MHPTIEDPSSSKRPSIWDVLLTGGVLSGPETSGSSILSDPRATASRIPPFPTTETRRSK